MIKVFVFLCSILALLSGCNRSEEGKQEVKKEVIPTPAPVTREERKVVAAKEVQKAKEEKASPKVRVDLSPLSGYKLGSLYASYLGIPGGQLAPAFVEVSFDERMSHLYHKKVSFQKCNKKTSVCAEASDTVLSQAPDLYKRYLESDKKKMNIKQFVAVAEKKVVSARSSLDWERVCKRYTLNVSKCSLLRAMVSKLNGKGVVAYGMTELLPSAEGCLNVAYMDILLRNAGAEFIYHVPALGDGLASLGFYQFTMFALRKDAEATEGASVINSFVKTGGDTIPGSVVYLAGDQHHTAAVYFAVHNLARLVSRLTPKGVARFAKVHGNYQDEVVVYIATAHHAPRIATDRTAIWINKGMKASLSNAYVKTRIHPYALKTKANLNALKEMK